jgi:putative SOS response-associated peptidase YedK
MPVILAEDAVEEWLYRDEKDLDKLQALLKPAPNALLVPTMVSQRVNSVKNDDASLLEADAPEAPKPAQGSLL